MKISASGKIWSIKLSHGAFFGKKHIPLFAETEISALEKYLEFVYPWSVDDKIPVKNISRVAKFLQALDPEKDNIIIHGDYDVDGITSTAMMVFLLRNLGHDPAYTLPNRFESGYGIDLSSVKKYAKSEGRNILLSLDTGTSEHGKIGELLKEGFSVCVVDHHEPSGALPEEVIIVNPSYFDETEGKIFTTAGLVLKIAEEILGEEDLKSFYPLAGMGTTCDVAPIISENWSIVRRALDNFPGESPGLRALMKISGATIPIKNYHLGFVFGPRINASGRMSDPEKSLEIFLSDSFEDAMGIAEILERENLDRRDATSRAVDEIFSNISSDEHTVVFGSENISRGIAGLIAGNVVTKRGGAAFIYEKTESICYGSARSDGSVDLPALLSDISDTIISGGGHKKAAGFSFDSAKENEFLENVKKYSNKHREKIIHQEYALFEIQNIAQNFLEKLFNLFSEFRPFGVENSEPTIFFRNLYTLSVRDIGKKKSHQRITFQDSFGNRSYAVFFSPPEKMIEGKMYDILFCVQRNEFRGNISYELQIKDFRDAV